MRHVIPCGMVHGELRRFLSGTVLYSGHCRRIPTKHLQCTQAWGAPCNFLAGVIKKIDRTKARSVMIKKLDVCLFDTLSAEQYWRYRDAQLPSVAVRAAAAATVARRLLLPTKAWRASSAA